MNADPKFLNNSIQGCDLTVQSSKSQSSQNYVTSPSKNPFHLPYLSDWYVFAGKADCLCCSFEPQISGVSTWPDEAIKDPNERTYLWASSRASYYSSYLPWRPNSCVQHWSQCRRCHNPSVKTELRIFWSLMAPCWNAEAFSVDFAPPKTDHHRRSSWAYCTCVCITCRLLFSAHRVHCDALVPCVVHLPSTCPRSLTLRPRHLTRSMTAREWLPSEGCGI